MSSSQPPATAKKRTFRRMKQFRCEGYGECGMVFSRGEHLARHVRKHTGEKPYKCEFPDCDKKFSRFDNMRQHAQTHLRLKKQQQNNADEVAIQPRPTFPVPYPYFPIVAPDQMNPQTPFTTTSDGREIGTQTATTTDQVTTVGANNTTSNSNTPSYSTTTITNNNNNQHGLVSPVSLSGTFEEQHHNQHQDIKVKAEALQDSNAKQPEEALGINTKHRQEEETDAEIKLEQKSDCNQNLHGLTQDELDALDGLNQFRQSPQSTCGSATNNETD